jgi:hypothetical protein
MTKKRANGEDSVFRCADGRVGGVFEDSNGETRHITSKTLTKTEVKAAVRKKLQEREEGIAHLHGTPPRKNRRTYARSVGLHHVPGNTRTATRTRYARLCSHAPPA